MTGSRMALLWLCWHRASLPVLIVSLAIPLLCWLVFTGMDASRSDDSRANTLIVIAAIGVWILGPMIASRTHGAKRVAPGMGFPLNTEFSYPVSTYKLVLIPFFFCIALLYGVFVLSTGALCLIYELPFPDPMIHFMVVEYLLIVTAIGWTTRSGYESAICWIFLLFLFYQGWIIPDFSFDSETGEFVAGNWSSTLLPALIAVSSVVLMLLGVNRQRAGENLLLSSSSHSLDFSGRAVLGIFQLISFPCPTTSGPAAMSWQQSQFRGVQVALGLGAAIGLAVVLVLAGTTARGVWDGPLQLDDVGGFALIFFCSVFVAHLAGQFGVSYANGAARIATFERTLPISTARMTFIRVGSGMLCIAVAAIAEIFVIAVLGSMLLDDFSLIRAEALEQLAALLEQGLFYTFLRLLLFCCLVYVIAVLWAVFISWMAIKPRPMAYGFSALAIYVLLLITALVVFTDSTNFVAMSRLLRDVHAWLLSAAVFVAAFYLLWVVVAEEVLRPAHAILLLCIGLLLASLQVFDLLFYEQAPTGSPFPSSVFPYVAGLLPLAATVLALWTQARVRHG